MAPGQSAGFAAFAGSNEGKEKIGNKSKTIRYFFT